MHTSRVAQLGCITSHLRGTLGAPRPCSSSPGRASSSPPPRRPCSTSGSRLLR